MKKITFSLIALIGLYLSSPQVNAQILTSVNSGYASSTGTTGGGPIAGNDTNTTGFQKDAVFVFQLPSLGAVANPFQTASFTSTVNSSNNAFNFGNNPQYQLYGLTASASSTILGSFYAQPANVGDTSIQNSYLPNNFDTNGGNVNSGSYTTSTGGSSNLLSYLNAQYASGAGAGEYVFLRISESGGNNGFSRVGFTGSATLNVTAVPEPSTYFLMAAGLLGLLFVQRGRRLNA